MLQMDSKKTKIITKHLKSIANTTFSASHEFVFSDLHFFDFRNFIENMLFDKNYHENLPH